MRPGAVFVLDVVGALAIAGLEKTEPLLNPLMTPHHGEQGSKGFQILTKERNNEKDFLKSVLLNPKGFIKNHTKHLNSHDAMPLFMAKKLHELEKGKDPDRAFIPVASYQLTTLSFILPLCAWPETMRERVKELSHLLDEKKGDKTVRGNNTVELRSPEVAGMPKDK